MASGSVIATSLSWFLGKLAIWLLGFWGKLALCAVDLVATRLVLGFCFHALVRSGSSMLSSVELVNGRGGLLFGVLGKVDSFWRKVAPFWNYLTVGKNMFAFK